MLHVSFGVCSFGCAMTSDSAVESTDTFLDWRLGTARSIRKCVQSNNGRCFCVTVSEVAHWSAFSRLSWAWTTGTCNGAWTLRKKLRDCLLTRAAAKLAYLMPPVVLASQPSTAFTMSGCPSVRDCKSKCLVFYLNKTNSWRLFEMKILS